MIFNMIHGGGGSGGEIIRGTFTKSSGTAVFPFYDLAGKPKFFVMSNISTSSTNGDMAYAVLQSDGTYVGKACTGRTAHSTRYHDSNAEWDDATHTFSIRAFNDYGDYEYFYQI